MWKVDSKRASKALTWLIVLAALAGLATWAAMRERGIDLGGTPEPEPPATPVPEAAALVS